MGDKLSYEDFKKIENTEFKVLDIAEDVVLKLDKVSEKKTTERQEIFSLWLETPLAYLLQQGNYRLAHEQLGECELFIVPVEQKENGFVYQAVFNRIKEN